MLANDNRPDPSLAEKENASQHNSQVDQSPTLHPIPTKKDSSKLPSFKHRDEQKEPSEGKPSTVNLHSEEEIIATAEALLNRAGTSIQALYLDRHGSNKRFNNKANGIEKEKGKKKLDSLDNIEKVKPEEYTTNYNPIQNLKEHKTTKFFHYFGIFSVLIITALLGFYLFKTISALTGDSTLTPDEIALAPEDIITPKITVLTEEAVPVKEATKVIKDFISSNSASFAITFIQPSTLTTDAFNKYWTKQDSFSIDQLAFQEGARLDNGTLWTSFTYDSSSGKRKLILEKKKDENFLIDWHSFAEVEAISLSDLMKGPNSPNLIRAWITQGDNELPKYQTQHWNCFVAHDLEGNAITCYLPRSSSMNTKITQGLANYGSPYSTNNENGAYVKMLVRKPEIDSSHLEILDIFSTSWYEHIEKLRIESGN